MPAENTQFKRKLDYNDRRDVTSYVLDVSKMDIPPINTIIDNLVLCPYLTHVRIEYSYAPSFSMNTDASKIFETLFNNCKYVTLIELENFSLTSIALQDIFLFPLLPNGLRVLLADNNVRTLDLNLPVSVELNTNLENTATILNELVPMGLALKNFSFQANEVPDRNVDDLVRRILCSSKHSLKALSLTGHMGSLGLQSFNQVPECTQLEYLSLTYGSKRSSEDFMKLVHLRDLRVLLLSNLHYIDSAQVQDVFRHENLRHLTCVRFCLCTAIKNEALRVLVYNCNNLQHVEIVNSGITDEGVSYILQCEFLKTLQLSFLHSVRGSFLAQFQHKLASLDYFCFKDTFGKVKEPAFLQAHDILKANHLKG